MERKVEDIVRRVSPDGWLTLLAIRETYTDGRETFAMGFEDSLWHVHPYQLENPLGHSEALICQEIADDVVADRMIIVDSQVQGRRYVSLLTSIEYEVDYATPGEPPKYWFWGGQQVSIEDLIDGKVKFKSLQ